MEKLERNGKIAVLVSPGFGAGWSTWIHKDTERAVFCPRIVFALLGESAENALTAAQAEFPSAYHGGVRDLMVEWVDKGVRFEITEYDGSETLRILTPQDGYTA